MIAKAAWAAEPEDYVTMYDNPDPDKTLVVALTTSETLFHPSSLTVWSYIAFVSLIPTKDPKSDVFLSNAKHPKHLGDQIRDLIWTLNTGHSEEPLSKCLLNTPWNQNPAKMMEKKC